MHFLTPALAQSAFTWTSALAGGLAVVGTALGLRRVLGDRKADRIERVLFAVTANDAAGFSSDLVADLPAPARRYLRHAIAPGTPLASAVRLRMTGTLAPTPGGPQVSLTADEVLAPRQGFVWTAHTRMAGLPVRVRDHYFAHDGGLHVDLLGLFPLPTAGGEDVACSSRGRLIAEAVWCPTTLVGPGVTWAAEDADHARFTLAVDDKALEVTLRVGPDGALREVRLLRWGDVGVASWRSLPYGFEVEEEATFGGVTIPSRLRGGWHYGTDRFDSASAATFSVQAATFAPG